MTPDNARDVMLGRIRGAIAQSKNAREPLTGDVERAYQRAGQLDAEARLQLFAQRLHEYDASVTRAEPDGISAAIAAIVTQTESENLDPVSQPWIVAEGFPADWLPSSGSFIGDRDADIDALNQCAGVLTVCTVGIAMTGSIVLQHGPGEGTRRISLLPDRHICVVEASQVVETVPEAFDRLAPYATRPLTFISGPSATADIEMTRIRGVHGPRRLDVILVGM